MCWFLHPCNLIRLEDDAALRSRLDALAAGQASLRREVDHLASLFERIESVEVGLAVDSRRIDGSVRALEARLSALEAGLAQRPAPAVRDVDPLAGIAGQICCKCGSVPTGDLGDVSADMANEAGLTPGTGASCGTIDALAGHW